MKQTVIAVSAFAIAFAWVEASVVVYLRDIYYPQGFAFPLHMIDQSRIGVELVREFATLVMLGAVGMLAGRTRWQRFAYFAIAFGVWDIFFYLWLKVMIDWPATIFEWDILFLLPIPWIGPVIAPIVISLVLIGGGWMILRVERSVPFRAPKAAWIFSLLGSFVALWTFMNGTDAAVNGAMPLPFHYEVFAGAMVLYASALWICWRENRGLTRKA